MKLESLLFFGKEKRGDKLHVHFLDWHRRWSHSLTLAAAVGLVAGLLFGKWAGIVAGLGFAGHILEDQLGFMGSNLFYPFTKRRSTGLQLLRSGDAIPNFLTVWTSVALSLVNLDRFSAQPRLNPAGFRGVAVVSAVAALGGLYQWQRRRGKRGRSGSGISWRRRRRWRWGKRQEGGNKPRRWPGAQRAVSDSTATTQRRLNHRARRF